MYNKSSFYSRKRVQLAVFQLAKAADPVMQSHVCRNWSPRWYGTWEERRKCPKGDRGMGGSVGDLRDGVST